MPPTTQSRKRKQTALKEAKPLVVKPIRPHFTRTGLNAHEPASSALYLVNRAPPVSALNRREAAFVDAAGFRYYHTAKQTVGLDWCGQIRTRQWFDEKRDNIYIIQKPKTALIIWPVANANKREEFYQLNETTTQVASGIILDSGVDVPVGAHKRSTNYVVLRDVIHSNLRSNEAF